jgi:hypothetical protein
MTQTLERFLEAAWHRTALLNRKMIGLAHSNLQFGFELARAKTLSDVLSLQADYWQKQWNAFRPEDFANESPRPSEPRPDEVETPRRVETAALPSAGAGAPQTLDLGVRPQAKAKTVQGVVSADIPEKPKQASAGTPPGKAAAPDPQPEKKTAKGRAKPAQGRPSSHEARVSERKAPARGRDAVSPSGADKIQFGMLDGNAVRFTSTEAWALRDGIWKRVPADEVLADAVVLSKARFDQRYKEVPPLPASAFRLKGKQNR